MKSTLLAAAFLSLLCLSACSSAAPGTDRPAATIDMVAAGFSPEKVTVKQGETVCWKNDSGEGRWPASNIHPTHEIYSEFDPKEPVKDGGSWCFTFTKAGIWQFHDHLLPEFGGTVTVE